MIQYAKAFHQINSWEEDTVWKVNECKGELSSELKTRGFHIPFAPLFKLCINVFLLSGFLFPRYWYFPLLLHRLLQRSDQSLDITSLQRFCSQPNPPWQQAGNSRHRGEKKREWKTWRSKLKAEKGKAEGGSGKKKLKKTQIQRKGRRVGKEGGRQDRKVEGRLPSRKLPSQGEEGPAGEEYLGCRSRCPTRAPPACPPCRRRRACALPAGRGCLGHGAASAAPHSISEDYSERKNRPSDEF